MLLVGAALLAAQPLGRRGRAEVRAAIAATGTHRAAAWSRAAKTATATGPRAAKAAATTRARTAETAATAGARTAETAGARCKSPGRTIFARTCLADGEAAPLERLRVELLDDLLGLFAVEEFDKGEPARTSGLAIHRHDDVGGFGDGREVGAKISFAGPVGEVPDEQTDSQGFLS